MKKTVFAHSDEKKVQPTEGPQRIFNKKMVERLEGLFKRIDEKIATPKKLKNKNKKDNRPLPTSLNVGPAKLMLKKWTQERNDFYVSLSQVVVVCESFISAVEFFFETKKYTIGILELETDIFTDIGNIYTLFEQHSNLYVVYFKTKYYQALRSFTDVGKIMNLSHILEVMEEVYLFKSEIPQHCFIQANSLNMLVIACVNFLCQKYNQSLEYHQIKPFFVKILKFSDRVILLFRSLPKDFYQTNPQFNEKVMYWKIIFHSITGILCHFGRIPLGEEEFFKEDMNLLLAKIDALTSENHSLILSEQQYGELLEVIKGFLLVHPQPNRACIRRALIKISNNFLLSLPTEGMRFYINNFKNHEADLELKQTLLSFSVPLVSQPLALPIPVDNPIKEKKESPNVHKILKLKDDKIREAIEDQKEVKTKLKVSKSQLKKKDRELESLRNELLDVRQELLAEREKTQAMEKVIPAQEKELQSLKGQLAVARGELLLQKDRQRRALEKDNLFEERIAGEMSAYEQRIDLLKLQVNSLKKTREAEQAASARQITFLRTQIAHLQIQEPVMGRGWQPNFSFVQNNISVSNHTHIGVAPPNPTAPKGGGPYTAIKLVG